MILSKQKSFSALLILLTSLSCTTYEIKKMPPEGLWGQCPRCRGYGKIKQVYTKKIFNSRDRQKDNERSCLLCPFMATDQYEKFEQHAEARQITDRNPKELPYRPQAEVKTKHVKCNVCDGIGWIQVEKNQRSIMFKKKTEMYDFQLK